MECLRCSGLMVLEHFCDYLDDTGRIDFKAYRCLVCGEILDGTILKHRKSLKPALTP
ncbi:MAG: hypothetical protein ACE5F7_10565 [Nitrospiria bacterium]